MKSFLEYLLINPKPQLKLLLKNLTTEQLKLIVEIIYKTAAENIPLSDGDKTKLSKHKSAIRKVLSPGITRRQGLEKVLKVSNLLAIFIRNYLQWHDN